MDSTPNRGNDQEIDLSQIMDKVNNVFEGFNSFVFRFLSFLIRNIIYIVLLLVIGIGLGSYLDSTRIYDNEVVVTPNFNSSDYLYSKIDQLQSHINEGDTLFLKEIGIAKPKDLLKIAVEPISDIFPFVSAKETNFELIKLMAENNDIKTVIEDKITSKNFSQHKITFITKGKTTQEQTLKPILAFLNKSDFFQQIRKEFINNIKLKIEADDKSITQINSILDQFGNKGLPGAHNPNMVYYNENTQLNDVILTKDKLTSELGNLRVQMISMDKIIKDNSSKLNVKYNKKITSKMKIILPLLLITLFIFARLFIRFYKAQSRKAKNIA